MWPTKSSHEERSVGSGSEVLAPKSVAISFIFEAASCRCLAYSVGLDWNILDGANLIFVCF